MAKCFTEWTVLPHQPIEKLSPNLWRVSGMLGNVHRQMVLARRANGDVVVFNPIALDDGEMRELEAWGSPSQLVIPNGFHRQDAFIWKKRYPEAKVVAPPKGVKRVGQIVPVDMTTHEAPGDDTVKLLRMEGCESDSLMEVRSNGDVSLVFCDSVLNVPKAGGAMGFFLAPTGEVSCPRVQRWFFIQNRRALGAQLERLAATPGLRRLIVGHGDVVDQDPAGKLKRVAAQLAN